MNVYTYAAFDPRPQGAATNDEIVDTAEIGVYGVEVTVPSLAEHCGLGNLDPQHAGGTNVAACVAALTCELPPAGATLATVRPDADALVAMAVLTLRTLGEEFCRPLVHIIGGADSAPAGPWRQGYQPAPEFSRVNAVAMNHREPLDQRVQTIITVLRGDLTVLPAVEPVDPAAFTVTMDDGYLVAVVRADGAAGKGACGEGYRHAPVIIAANEAFTMRGEEPHRKYTVARWNERITMDWDGMMEELRALEPGWGGSRSIAGSTQGVGSPLELEQVVAIVERHMPPLHAVDALDAQTGETVELNADDEPETGTLIWTRTPYKKPFGIMWTRQDKGWCRAGATTQHYGWAAVVETIARDVTCGNGIPVLLPTAR